MLYVWKLQGKVKHNASGSSLVISAASRALVKWSGRIWHCWETCLFFFFW